MNLAEDAVVERYRAAGDTVLCSGWPDIITIRGRLVTAIELKIGNDIVHPNQLAMHAVLRDCGLPVEIVRVPKLEPDEVQRAMISRAKRVIAASEVGWSHSKIQREYGIGTHTIYDILGTSSRGVGRPRLLSGETLCVIAALKSTGKSIAEIAEETGEKYGLVYHAVRTYLTETN